MFKKTITYTDFNGDSHTENFYFNLNKAELAIMEISTPGGIKGYADSLIAAHDTKGIVDLFTKLISMSYGVKSPDGRRFIKSEEATEEFIQTNAYGELIVDLITNAEEAAAFFNGLAESIIATGKLADKEHQTLSVVAK